MDPRLPSWPVLVASVVGLALASAAFPLLTYTVSLAVFGGAHVMAELRYVRVRFGDRVGTQLGFAMFGLLAAIVGVRLLSLFGVLDAGWAGPLELALVVVLTASVLPLLRGHGRLVGASFVASVAAGLLVSPVLTLLAFAVLHNLTPVGFIAEGWPGASRTRALSLAGLVFVGVPLLIATGLPFAALHALGWARPELSVLPAGPLATQLGVYLPPSMHGSAWALHAFSAVVCAQTLHYAAVLGVLPRMARLPTPRGAWVIGAGLGLAILLVGFTVNFRLARSIYAIPAAVHAWIELPLLLLFLLPRRTIYSAAMTSPSPKEPRLSTAENA